jgi:hypothetical protein
MRDNARRLLTILTVILALWLVLGFWPLSIGNQVIFSLCILLAGGAGSALGTGGMLTKVTAAKRATEAGVDMIITNGAHAEVLYDIVEGKPVGTRFVGRKA